MSESRPPDWEAQLRERDERIAQLERETTQLRQQIQQLQEQMRQLQEELAQLKRAGKRQATPFARRERKEKPKRPGRRRGQGSFCYRQPPAEEQGDQTLEAPLEACPHCGGTVEELERQEQVVYDIPPVEPVVTRYVTWRGRCACCGETVHSHHPEQISSATGAAGVQIGPRAKALAADLKHRLGLSYEKIADLMAEVFRLDSCRSTWYQADQRLAQSAQPVYEELIEQLRHSAVVHTDETGWRIGTLSAWLWVFCAQETTVYAIDPSRGHEVVVEILGREFAGVLHSDCFTCYDHQELEAWLKQKCIAHLLRKASQIEAHQTRAGVCFARGVAQLLREAQQLKAVQPDLDQAAFQRRAQELEQRLDALISERRRFSDPDNARFAKLLRKHRPHLLRFLYCDELDATNNLAERQLRPAVIARKTNGCHRTDQGARAHAILASIAATCKQRALSILDFLERIQLTFSQPPRLGSP